MDGLLYDLPLEIPEPTYRDVFHRSYVTDFRHLGHGPSSWSFPVSGGTKSTFPIHYTETITSGQVNTLVPGEYDV